MAKMYRQRVWYAGAMPDNPPGWAYYEKPTIDPNPSSSETSPNAVGALSAHSVVGVREDSSVATDREVSTDDNIVSTDEIIRVDTSGGNVLLTLLDPALRWKGMIKKSTTDTNTISLVQSASENIEGTAATYALPGSAETDRDAWMVWSDGTDYWVA